MLQLVDQGKYLTDNNLTKRSRKLKEDRAEQIIHTFRTIREQASITGLQDLMVAAAERECDFISCYLNHTFKQASESPGLREHFEEAIRVLEKHKQTPTTATSFSGMPSSSAPSTSLLPSTNVVASGSTRTDVPDSLSDRYLDSRVESFRVNLKQDRHALQWSDVGGMVKFKQSLDRWYKTVEFFGHLKSTASSTGILLHGVHGTGKTTAVEAFARHTGYPLFKLSADGILGKLVGESEKLVKLLFDKIKSEAPSILIMDEVESILSVPASGEPNSLRLQGKIKEEWGQLINSTEAVIVIGTTNAPWAIPSAGFGRRFNERYLVGLPDSAARTTIWNHFTARHWRDFENNSGAIENLVEVSGCLTGDDISRVVQKLVTKMCAFAADTTSWTQRAFEGQAYWIPDPDSPTPDRSISLAKISKEERREYHHGPVTEQALLRELAENKPRYQTVWPKDLEQHEEFARRWNRSETPEDLEEDEEFATRWNSPE